MEMIGVSSLRVGRRMFCRRHELPMNLSKKITVNLQNEYWDDCIFRQNILRQKWSPTYGQWYGLELSAKNKKQLFIPQWFAHGFLSLEDNTEFLYLVDDVYDQSSEAWLMRNDPEIGIDRDMYLQKYNVTEVLLSDKDKTHPTFGELPHYFSYTSW
jgi:dTDP-4-dehydrorhamnose 3,5-epimerase